MAHDTPSNFIRQTVGSSVATNDPETIDVSDASAFPDPSTSQYDIVIWDAGSHNRPDQDSDVEVLTVTGRDTGNNTLTCSRGQQGTANVSHPTTSDVIVAPLSVGDFNTVNTQTANIENQSALRAYLSGDQSIPSGSFVQVQLDATSYDVRGETDTTNHEIVVDEAGVYLLAGSVGFRNSANDGDDLTVRINVNGSPLSQARTVIGGSSSPNLFVLSTDLLNAGDSITLLGRNLDSSSTFIGGQVQTNLSVIRVH